MANRINTALNVGRGTNFETVAPAVAPATQPPTEPGFTLGGPPPTALRLDGAPGNDVVAPGGDVFGVTDTSAFRQFFTPEQWAIVDSEQSVSDGLWLSLSREQRQAVFAVRGERLKASREEALVASGARRFFDDAQWQYIVSGERFPEADWLALSQEQRTAARQIRATDLRPGRTVADVMADARRAPPDPRVVEPWEQLAPNRVMAMGLNSENVFREKDDPLKADEEFTAARGYTQMAFYRHLQNLGDAIKSVNGGLGSHIVAMPELEDRQALEKMVDFELSGLGYQTVVLLEGKDSRGIDVGLISKFPLWPGSTPTLIFTPEGSDGQRGVLRVELNVNGRHTAVYVNHWKSMRGGEERSVEINARIAAAARADFAEIVRRDPRASVLFLGDFNTKMKEGPQPAIEALGAQVSPQGLTPTSLWDVTNTIPERLAQGAAHVLLPNGTHEFRGEGDYLDRLMVNDNLATGAGGLQLVPNSLVVLPSPGRYFGKKPGEFNANGVSDHRPYVVQLEMT